MTPREQQPEINASSLVLRLNLIGASAGLLTGLLAITFALQLIQTDANQRMFLMWGVIIFALLSVTVYHTMLFRILRPISRHLNGDPGDSQYSEISRAALHAVNRAPRQMAILGSSFYPIISISIIGAAAMHFPYFDRQSGILALLDISGIGFLSQMAVYVLYKQTLHPLRNQLAVEIKDPEERDQLAPWFPLARKISIAMFSLTIISIVIIASVNQTRSRNSIEYITNDNFELILERFDSEEFLVLSDQELLDHVDSHYGMLAIEFALLSPGGQDVTLGRNDILTDYEISHIQASPQEGNTSSLSTPNIFSWHTLSDGRGVLIAVGAKDRLRGETNKTREAIAFYALVVVALTAIIVFFTSRDINESMDSLRSQIGQIAEGDLRSGDSFESEDEFGRLSRSLDSMSFSLKNTISKVAVTVDRVDQAVSDISSASGDVSAVTRDQVEGIRQANTSMSNVTEQADGITRASDSLTSSVEESTGAAIEIKAVGEELNENTGTLSIKATDSQKAVQSMIVDIQEIAQKTERLSTAVGEAATNIEEMAEQIERIESNARETERLSQEVTNAADQGRERVEQTIDGMDAIHTATETAQEVIRELGSRTTDIGAIINVIDSVADETNLLALNAAIISAQAGEHGRAFAVVSDEIKDLADRFGANTKEIGEVIHGLQSQSTNAIGVIEGGVANVQGGVELALEAGVALRKITESAEQSRKQVGEIAGLVHEHTISAEHAVELIDRVRSDASDIHKASENQASAAQTVLSASESLGDMTRQVGITTEEQGRSTGFIAKNLESVKDEVGGIHKALNEQLDACRQTEDFLANLLERTQENEKSTESMNTAMGELAEESEELRENIRNFRL